MDFSYEICGLVFLERVNKDYVLNEVCVWGVLWHFFGEFDTIIWTIWQLCQDNFDPFSKTVLTYSQKYINWVNLLNAQTQFLILTGTLKQGFKASLGKIQKTVCWRSIELIGVLAATSCETKGMMIPILLRKKGLRESWRLLHQSWEHRHQWGHQWWHNNSTTGKKFPCHSVDATYTGRASYQVIMALPGLLGVARCRRRDV